MEKESTTAIAHVKGPQSPPTLRPLLSILERLSGLM